MEEKRKKILLKVTIIILTMFLILLIALPVVKVLNSSYSIIIKDKDQNYYRGVNLFVCGNTVICKRDSESVKERSMLPDEDRSRYSYKFISMHDVISIEIVPDDETPADEALPVHQQHLGKFKIHLQGHEGILILGVSKDRVYGTVRFPSWGKGAVETLKGVRVNSGGVKFLRSASTPEEIKRLGANYLFKQKFSGSFNPTGKIIKGFMVNDRGEKYEWEAERK